MGLTKKSFKKEVSLIINTKRTYWNEARISYERIVKFAFGDYYANIVYTVTCYSKDGYNGSLIAGQSVDAMDNMTFNVSVTNNA